LHRTIDFRSAAIYVGPVWARERFIGAILDEAE
jgi:hypothetical protein